MAWRIPLPSEAGIKPNIGHLKEFARADQEQYLSFRQLGTEKDLSVALMRNVRS